MFLWALCFPLITVGLAFAPPLTLAALRSFVAGAGLAAGQVEIWDSLADDTRTV